MLAKYEAVEKLGNLCSQYKLKASAVNEYLVESGSVPLSESRKVSEIAARPAIKLSSLLSFVPRGTQEKFDVCLPEGEDFSSRQKRREIIDSVEIEIKYRGYIDRERVIAQKIERLENLSIPDNFDFDKVTGLTIECRQKLKKYKPATIAQASRISGVSPSDISVLLVYFGR